VIPAGEGRARLFSLTTGIETTPAELDAMAERAITLERREQVRDLSTRADEEHMMCFFCETDRWLANPLLGEKRRADPQHVAMLAREFYSLWGWDPETGRPPEEHGAVASSPAVIPARAEGEA